MAGALAGAMRPAQAILQIGDGIAIRNDDVVGHDFAFDPAVHEAVTVAAQSTSDPIHLLSPGTARVPSDDVQPLTAEIDVRPPPAPPNP